MFFKIIQTVKNENHSIIGEDELFTKTEDDEGSKIQKDVSADIINHQSSSPKIAPMQLNEIADEIIQNEFLQFLETLDAKGLCDIVLEFVDDENDVREFLDTILDDVTKEHVIEAYKEDTI